MYANPTGCQGVARLSTIRPRLNKQCSWPHRSIVLSVRPGQDPQADPVGPGEPNRPGAIRRRGAGRADIIDEHDLFWNMFSI